MCSQRGVFPTTPSHTKPVPHTTAPSTFRPPTQLGASAATQTPVSDLGEGAVVPEHKGYGEDLASGLEKLRKQAEVSLVQPNTREKVLQAIRKAVSAVSGEK